jgi:ATP-dependent RNA helicase DeaD
VQSFEDLGTAPELTEALAAEGIETPTPLQESAIPVVRQGNNIILEAGPGSGLHAAWAVGVLERVEPDGLKPKALVLCATRDTADRLAESTARLASRTDHRIAALGSSWVLPEQADVLFATAEDALSRLVAGSLAADAVSILVIDQAHLVEETSGLGGVEQVMDYLPSGTQRILSALPMTEAVTDFAERHLKRTVRIPTPETDVQRRGDVRFRIGPEPRETVALRVIEDVLGDGARHVLVFCRTEDRAADVGDYLSLHGFAAGPPGDESVPVWLGVDALEAREAVRGIGSVVVVSCDAPADPDTLDRRHSHGADGVVVVLPREVAHLRNLGRRTGYGTVPFPPRPREHDEIDRLRRTVEEALASEDIAPYMLALEPLLERYDAVEVAAAALALVRRKAPAAGEGTPATAGRAEERAGAAPAWAKLFVTVGERDGLKKGDLVGAITGETGVPGDAVGRIDIKESHSLVEVHDSVARQVIQALNGTTIKGRSVRADFDRPRKSAAPARRPRPRQDR